jgi:hypothetical protein
MDRPNIATIRVHDTHVEGEEQHSLPFSAVLRSLQTETDAEPLLLLCTDIGVQSAVGPSSVTPL